MQQLLQQSKRNGNTYFNPATLRNGNVTWKMLRISLSVFYLRRGRRVKNSSYSHDNCHTHMHILLYNTKKVIYISFI